MTKELPQESHLMIEGKRLGLFSFGLTMAVFLASVVVHLASGGSFNPVKMYISDLGDIPGWTSVIYKTGMLLLVPLRFLFLLYVLHVFQQLGIGKRIRFLLLVLGILIALGTTGVTSINYELSHILHMASAFVYFFPALFLQTIIAVLERKESKLPRILPTSGFINVGGFAFFLFSLILVSTLSGFPRFLSTVSEWTILVTLMFWLVVHSLYLKVPSGDEN